MIVYTFQKDNSSSILESFLIGGRKAQWKWKTSQETDVQWIQKLLREQPPQVLEAHQVLYITEKGQSRITGKLLGPWEHQIGKINFEKWGNTFSSCTFLPCKAEQNHPLGCSKPQSEVLLALGIQSCTELAQGYKQPSQSPGFNLVQCFSGQEPHLLLSPTQCYSQDRHSEYAEPQGQGEVVLCAVRLEGDQILMLGVANLFFLLVNIP